MWLTEVIAVVALATVAGASFLGTMSLGVYLVHTVVKAWFGYLERSLDLRRFEVESRLEQARIGSSIPLWIDRADPLEVAAWNRAVAETWRITASKHLASRN